jgi:N-acyl-D-amino-acid deacylase
MAAQEEPAGAVIDAGGLHLAPGFIDIHNHSDLTLLLDPRAESMVAQGVTTVVVGNCGFSVAPWGGPEGGPNALLMRQDASFLAAGLEDTSGWQWRSFADYLDVLSAGRPAVNVLALVGHATIREQVMGRSTRVPDAEEMRKMKEMLEAALAEGAAGLSSGLIYYPSCYARTEELVELACSVSEAGKMYATHIRGEGETLLQAVGEAIEIARRTGVSTQISHIKAESRLMWGRLGEALALVDAARREGLRVDCDQYPYAAYNTSLGSFLPPELMESDWRAVLSSREGRSRVRRIMEEGQPGWTSSVRGMEWSDFVIDGTGDASLDGADLATVAARQGKDPFDAFFDVLLSFGPHVRVVGHAMDEGDVTLGVSRPDVMVGSDGFALPLDGEGFPHPRSFGTFPRVLGRYCIQKRVISLEQGVRKMTALPAAKLGLRDRGLVREGYWADLVLFDAARVKDTGTFRHPRRRPEGIAYVFVNGHLALGPTGQGGRWGVIVR